MSYAKELNQKLQTGSTDIVRAVIYARVSTDTEGQKESCSNQVDLAKGYLANHPNVKLIATYIDDGISGKNDFTRPQYNKMLQQLSMDGFDLILTKALSRLNRDELNSLLLNSMLIEHDATVLTLEDGQLHDFEDINTGLLHSIKYAIDAQFVKQQSLHGRKTHELRCKRKELSAKDCSYGYEWHRDDKSITINDEQANIVRRIFEDYVYRNGTPASIQRALRAEGISICGRTVSNIIQDERYIGRFYINKRTTKLGTGQTMSKRIKLPKEQWVLCERPDLQIIDTELFEMAQRIHQSRITTYEKPNKQTTQARFQGTHLFAKKIFCPICGASFLHDYADRAKTIHIYRIKNHSNCTSPINRVYEKDLEEITKHALRQIIENNKEICASLESILTTVIESSLRNDGTEIEKLKARKSKKEQSMDNLIDQLSEGGLTPTAAEHIKEKINSITEEIERLTEDIQAKESCKIDTSYIAEKIGNIRKSIYELCQFTSIDRDRILTYIERIEMKPNGDIEILLRSGQTISAGKMRIQDARYSSPAAYRSPPGRALRRQ